jgi:hypothetical protein
LNEFEKLKGLELGSFTETGPKMAWFGVPWANETVGAANARSTHTRATAVHVRRNQRATRGVTVERYKAVASRLFLSQPDFCGMIKCEPINV